jgi:hypothetical protein
MNMIEEKTKNQGTSKPEASNEKVNGDMASEWEELVELDDVQLATVVGGFVDDRMSHDIHYEPISGGGSEGSFWNVAELY